MAKKQYKIRAKLVFNGQVIVAAHSRQEAEAIAEKGIAGSHHTHPGEDGSGSAAPGEGENAAPDGR